MALTYKEAKKLLAQYAESGGRCSTSSDVDMFIREVFEYLLYSGANQDLRKFTFTTQRGIFTVPNEIESIQKVKIDNKVATSFDKWFEFRSSNEWSNADCYCFDEALNEEPNYYSTAYDIPAGGACVGTLGTCDEASDAHIIFQGKDLTGREIFTNHQGTPVSGEYVSIKKGVRTFGAVTFGQITGVTKTKTNGYVQALTNTGTFLSDYSPLEQVPSYRRYRLRTADCGSCVKVSVLARIRLKEAYSDNDRIPFETLLILRLGGQRCNAEYNNDVQTAAAKDVAMSSMIEREAAHKRIQNGSPIEFMQSISAGRIRNIVGGWARWRRAT